MGGSVKRERVQIELIECIPAGRGSALGGVGQEHGRDAPGPGRGRGFNNFGRGRTPGKGSSQPISKEPGGDNPDFDLSVLSAVHLHKHN